jgi:signal transduction histidine kinase
VQDRKLVSELRLQVGAEPFDLRREGRDYMRSLVMGARRDPGEAVLVELDVSVHRRLGESAEVAAYYIVAEALTNAAKHAQASQVNVQVEGVGSNLRLSIRDDGIGGADPTNGSGLIGLRDRVEALGGQMTISSPPGSGTSLIAEMPLQVG